MPLVSEVIPVYNSMPYPAELLNSLETQDLPGEKFEVVAVNDVSTDYGDEILVVYAIRNSNFTIVHQENGGWLRNPRNVGIGGRRGQTDLFSKNRPNLSLELALESLSLQKMIRRELSKSTALGSAKRKTVQKTACLWSRPVWRPSSSVSSPIRLLRDSIALERAEVQRWTHRPGGICRLIEHHCPDGTRAYR